MMAVTAEKKRVSVTFAGDDDVIQHIVPIADRRSSLRTRKPPTPHKTKQAPAPVQETEEDDCHDSEEEVFKHSEALVDDSDVGGADVFGFKSVKRSGQMAKKATESAQAHTPKRTLKSALKKSTLLGTPKSGMKKGRKLEATTPFRLRKRNKDDDVSSDESISSEDSEDETENRAPQTPKGRKTKPSAATPKGTPKGTPSRTPSGRKRQKAAEVEQVQPEAVEAYFAAQSDMALTSDRTLARLETPRMDQEALNEALKDVEVGYKKERVILYEEHKANFKKWMYLMCNSYNLLLHGLGSKCRLIEDFRTGFLADFNHVVINGFFPSLTIKSILNAITDDVLEHAGSFSSPIDQCDFIRKQYESGEYEDFYLIVHNIDGSMLRSEKAQLVLSMLAQVRGIHIIASIDHINASLIWDQTKASRFNWLWFDVTTYDAYSEETSYENSLLVQQSGTLALSSLTHVMRSLTPNARGIFMILVENELDNKDNAHYLGLSFPDLYQRCREAFLVNSDLTLRTQLTEFRDHKLVRTKKGVDGMEYLGIPLDSATLVEFKEQQENDA